ncbi:MAG: Crp/Fnr family transcriptional regulator [Candidatus Pristimantibacillus sp.]
MTLSYRQPVRMEWNLGSSYSAQLMTKLLQLSPRSFTYKTIKAGQQLYREGTPCSALYCVTSGTVKLRKTSHDGRSLLLTIAGPGELIGEPRTFSDISGSATFHRSSAMAVVDTIVAVLYHNDFEQLISQDCEAAYLFGKTMANKRLIAESKLRDLLNVPKLSALASCLIRLGNSFGVTSATGIKIDVKLTHTELGEMIGATRESVNRLLATLREQDTIGASRGLIVIESPQELRKLAGCPECPACADEVCQI